MMSPGMTVAEVGPGDSIGVGMSALLSGADRYYALDAKAHATPALNRRNLAELISLFETMSPIPDDGEFPDVYPKLVTYAFPVHILTRKLLEHTLRHERLERISASLSGGGHSGEISIRYLAPWDDLTICAPGEVDLVISQAVLEHVHDMPTTYAALHRMLKPGGFMSHSVDFRSHRLTRAWNGHWTIPDWEWKLVYGKRPYLINRLAYSEHLDLMRQTGFEIVRTVPIPGSPLDPCHLANRFRHLKSNDLGIMGTLFQAKVPQY